MDLTRRHGRPGEPGEPGEPGKPPGGGAGGRGGTGGKGGDAPNGRHRWAWVLAFVVLVAIGLSVNSAIQANRIENNTDQIQALEKSDVQALQAQDKRLDRQLQLIRETDYRLCVRQQVIRLAMNADANHDEPILLVYDCRPDLHGGLAKQLTPAQARKMQREIAARGYTP